MRKSNPLDRARIYRLTGPLVRIRLAFAACVATAGLLYADSVFAQYGRQSSYSNPLTGGYKSFNPYVGGYGDVSSVVGYNPVTGSYGARRGGSDAGTGPFGRASAGTDTATGEKGAVAGRDTLGYNPYTGNQYVAGRSYNPHTGQRALNGGSYNPMTGNGR
jgi:hypothetical protein